MTNTDDDLGLITLDKANTESLRKGTILRSEYGSFECMYGFRPRDMEADIFCYSPSVGFRSPRQGKYWCFIKLEFGALVWTYNPIDTLLGLSIASNLYTLLPRGPKNYYGIHDKNRNLNKQATISAFGFTFEELSEIIQAYCKTFRIYGYQEGRITFSKTNDNQCDLTGNTIPQGFPYITFAPSDCLWSHISFIGFYSHLSLLIKNGNESALYRSMIDSGCPEELLKRVIEIPSQVSANRVCVSSY